ncbi:hypothetical protein [Mycolicibacterium brisbanense]
MADICWLCRGRIDYWPHHVRTWRHRAALLPLVPFILLRRVWRRLCGEKGPGDL